LPAEVIAQKRHLDWLRDELEKECRQYLEIIARVRALPEGGEARADEEGYLSAWITQLGSTIEQIENAEEAYLDALPNDENAG
jgi:methylmalonyl-CoA mutase N-terminal domain/subunit